MFLIKALIKSMSRSNNYCNIVIVMTSYGIWIICDFIGQNKILDCSYYLVLRLLIWGGGWGCWESNHSVKHAQPSLCHWDIAPAPLHSHDWRKWVAYTIHLTFSAFLLVSEFSTGANSLIPGWYHRQPSWWLKTERASHSVAGGSLIVLFLTTKRREEFSIHFKLPCIFSHSEVIFPRQI